MPVLAGPYRAWTFEDLQQVPDFDEAGNQVDWRRIEILDGSLVVSPTPATWHGLAGSLLRSALAGQAPPSSTVVDSLGVAIEDSYLVPDLIVAETEVLRRNAEVLQPDEVLLAVEIVSPGSRTMDRITKPARYAEAGVRAFWRVETEPAVSLTAYTLAPGARTYTELGRWARGEVAVIDRPFPARIEIDMIDPSR